MKKKVIFPSKYLHTSKFIRIFAKKSDVFALWKVDIK